MKTYVNRFHGLYEQSGINWLCYIAECNQFIWTGYNTCPYHCKKITSELFMMMFGVLGTTMANLGQNLGAGKYERIRKALTLSIWDGMVCYVSSHHIR